MKRAGLVCVAALMLALSGCACVTIKPVDFSWPFESVLTADAAGVVRGEPKTITFDAGELFRAETKKQGTAADKTVRIIRDKDGYYYITADGFKHVYIFKSAEGKLTLEKKVLIDENGIGQPFFNGRDQGIELGANGRLYLLSKKGIVSGGTK